MRIAFLAHSAVPGSGGVADYALRLAEAVAGENGVAATVIPLGGPEDDASSHALLREFRPDWISLQFVPYAFDRRGLAWNLGGRLSRLADGAKWHVMFHEIWIGAKQGAPVRQRLLGWAQRICLVRAVRKLQPRRIHTSNATYQSLLARAGIETELLPLFGNIPIVPPSHDAGLRALLAPHGIDLDDSAARARQLLIGFFGALHPIWPAEPLFTHVQEAQVLSGRRPVLISMGRLGPGRELWARLRRQYGDRFTFVELGEQSPERISRLLQALDWGIATTPWQVIGKSGSAAAMAEHGLPVIVNRTERYGLPTDAEPQPPYLPMNVGLPHLLSGIPPRRPTASLLSTVARQLVQAIVRS